MTLRMLMIVTKFAIVAGSSGMGVLMEWQQPTSSIYISGAHRFIRLYDANKELQIQDIMTGSESAVTSLCTDPIARHRVIASCNDGSIRLFDRRLPSPEGYSKSRFCGERRGEGVREGEDRMEE